MTAGWTWIHWEAPGPLPCVAVLVQRDTGAAERFVRAASPTERDTAIAAADNERLANSIRAWLAAQEAA